MRRVAELPLSISMRGSSQRGNNDRSQGEKMLTIASGAGCTRSTRLRVQVAVHVVIRQCFFVASDQNFLSELRPPFFSTLLAIGGTCSYCREEAALYLPPSGALGRTAIWWRTNCRGKTKNNRRRPHAFRDSRTDHNKETPAAPLALKTIRSSGQRTMEGQRQLGRGQRRLLFSPRPPSRCTPAHSPLISRTNFSSR